MSTEEKIASTASKDRAHTPEMTPEMLANFGKKAKEKKEKASMKGDALDARARTASGKTTLVTLGAFLKAIAVPVIPIYQRVNGWTDLQKRTFREAIENLLAHPKAAPFFIGTISTAKSRDGKAVFIIDGQQRLSTLNELFAGRFELEKHNGLTRTIAEPLTPFTGLSADETTALFERIVFVHHDYGEIDLEEQILAFDELNRHEEAYRLADRYRSSMLSALPPKDHEAFSRELDRAWRLSTVLFRLANTEDFELSFDLADQERPQERPSLFRLASPAEIAARIAPTGTPRPYIPEEKTLSNSLLPLAEPLPAPSEAEREDEEPLVSMRDALSRSRAIREMIRAFLAKLERDESAHTLTGAFLDNANIFSARRELDFAEHLSTKAKYFAYLCYLRAANPNGRVPVAWADAFGRTVSGGIERLLPIREGEALSSREAKRILSRLSHNNDWVVGLLAAYRGALDVAADRSPAQSAAQTWLAVIRFLGDGWLQLAQPGETSFAVQMMDEEAYFTQAEAKQFWHTLETWAKRSAPSEESVALLTLRAREAVLYRLLLTAPKTIEACLAALLAEHKAEQGEQSALKDPKRAAARIVAFMKEATARRTLPAAEGGAVIAPWVVRDLPELEGKVPYRAVESLANQVLLPKALAERLGDIHPDVKSTMLEAGLGQVVPWSGALLSAALSRELRGEKTAAALSARITLLERFWARLL